MKEKQEGMDISILKLEKLYFVILMFNCFCSDWGNEMLGLGETSTPMNTKPALFRNLKEGDLL